MPRLKNIRLTPKPTSARYVRQIVASIRLTNCLSGLSKLTRTRRTKIFCGWATRLQILSAISRNSPAMNFYLSCASDGSQPFQEYARRRGNRDPVNLHDWSADDPFPASLIQRSLADGAEWSGWKFLQSSYRSLDNVSRQTGSAVSIRQRRSLWTLEVHYYTRRLDVTYV